MISEELSLKYIGVSSVENYPYGEQMYYKTFLIQTDYITAKITEMLVQGVESAAIMEKYGELLSLRQFARDKVNEAEAAGTSGTVNEEAATGTSSTVNEAEAAAVSDTAQ